MGFLQDWLGHLARRGSNSNNKCLQPQAPLLKVQLTKAADDFLAFYRVQYLRSKGCRPARPG